MPVSVDETHKVTLVNGDPSVVRLEGPTPNGGVYAIAFCADEKMNPCPKDQAVNIEIHEYDKNGVCIQRTYGRCDNNPAPLSE
jgi:hypothetical protein